MPPKPGAARGKTPKNVFNKSKEGKSTEGTSSSSGNHRVTEGRVSQVSDHSEVSEVSESSGQVVGLVISEESDQSVVSGMKFYLNSVSISRFTN